MEGVGYVRIFLDNQQNQCQQFVTNLSKLRQQILYHLGSVVCSMYGLIHEKLTLGLGM